MFVSRFYKLGSLEQSVVYGTVVCIVLSGILLHCIVYTYLIKLLARSTQRSIGDKSGLCNWILCLFSVGSLYVCYKFSNSFQHNIRLLSCNCDPCATEFVVGVNLRRHDTLRQAVINFMMIFLWEWSKENILGAAPNAGPCHLSLIKWIFESPSTKYYWCIIYLILWW